MKDISSTIKPWQCKEPRHCISRLQFIRNLMNELKSNGVGNGISGPIVFLIDNAACKPLTKYVGVSKPTEHFMRWQLYLRWLVFCGLAVVVWVSTDDETGDVMTKVLPSTTYLKHKRQMLNYAKR